MSPVGLNGGINKYNNDDLKLKTSTPSNDILRKATTADGLGAFHAIEFNDSKLKSGTMKSSTQLPLMEKTEIQNLSANANIINLSEENILQNKSAFLNKINGSGDIILKVPAYKDNYNLQGYVFINLNKLDSESKSNLINTISDKIQKYSEDPNQKLTLIDFKFPYYEVEKYNKTNIISYNLGGLECNVEPEKQKIVTNTTVKAEKKESFRVDAKDLSKIKGLDDDSVKDLINNTTKFISQETGKDIKTTKATDEKTINPTIGFDLNDTTGKKQVRTMIDGYLKAGGFDKELYKSDPKYQQKVKDGIAEMIKGGFNQTIKDKTGIVSEKALTDKFVKAIFENESLAPADIKTIQAGFAAMSKNSPEFSNIINMPNPQTREIPKDQGIDGVPATRFAVVTSTLFAKMQEQIKPEVKIQTTTISEPSKIAPVTLKDFESFDKELKIKAKYTMSAEELKKIGK